MKDAPARWTKIALAALGVIALAVGGGAVGASAAKVELPTYLPPPDPPPVTDRRLTAAEREIVDLRVGVATDRATIHAIDKRTQRMEDTLGEIQKALRK